MSTELSMLNLQTSILDFTDSTGGQNIVKLLIPVFQCLYINKGSSFCGLCLGLSIHVAFDTSFSTDNFCEIFMQVSISNGQSTHYGNF